MATTILLLALVLGPVILYALIEDDEVILMVGTTNGKPKVVLKKNRISPIHYVFVKIDGKWLIAQNFEGVDYHRQKQLDAIYKEFGEDVCTD